MTETLTRPQANTFAAVQRDVTSLLHAVKSGGAPLDIEDQGLVFDVCDHVCAALAHTPALAQKVADLLETFAQSQSTLGVYARLFVSRHACTLPDHDPSRVHIFDGISKQGDDFSAVVWHRTITGDRTSRVNQTDLTAYLAQANRYQLLLYIGTNKDMSLRAAALAHNMAYDSPTQDNTADHVPDITPTVFEAVKALHILQKIPAAAHEARAKLVQTLQRSLVKSQPAKPQPSARNAFKVAAAPNPARVIQKLNAPALARFKAPVKAQPAKPQPSARAAFKVAAAPNPARVIQKLNVPALARLKAPTKAQPAKPQPSARAAFKVAATLDPARVIQKLNVSVLAHLRPKPSLRQVMQRAAAQSPVRIQPRARTHARIVQSRTLQLAVQRAVSARALFKRASVMRSPRIVPSVFVSALAHLRSAKRAEMRTVTLSSPRTTFMQRAAVNTHEDRSTVATANVPRQPDRAISAPAQKLFKQPELQVEPAPLKPTLAKIPDTKPDAPRPEQLHIADRPITSLKNDPILEPISNPIYKPIGEPIPILNRFLKLFKPKNQTDRRDTPTPDKPAEAPKELLKNPDGPPRVEPKPETPLPPPPSNAPARDSETATKLGEDGKVRECCTPEFQKAVLSLAALAAAERAANRGEPTPAGNLNLTPTVEITHTPAGVVLRDTKTGETTIITPKELELNEQKHKDLTEKLKKLTPKHEPQIRPAR